MHLAPALILIILGIAIVVTCLARYAKTKNPQCLVILGIFLSGMLWGGVVFALTVLA